MWPPPSTLRPRNRSARHDRPHGECAHPPEAEQHAREGSHDQQGYKKIREREQGRAAQAAEKKAKVKPKPTFKQDDHQGDRRENGTNLAEGVGSHEVGDRTQQDSQNQQQEDVWNLGPKEKVILGVCQEHQ